MVIVTISGTPGSGKSTIAKLLEEKLGIKTSQFCKLDKIVGIAIGISTDIQDYFRISLSRESCGYGWSQDILDASKAK